MRFRKYSLSNRSGDRVHLPSYPERTKWHRPSVCAPESATMSLSDMPMRWKTSLRWVAPCEASGKRPCAGHLAPSRSSVRPNACGTWGPPANSMDSAPARVKMSACDTSGYFLCTSWSMSRTMPRPAFAGSDRSGSNLIVPPSDPPDPSLASKVPDACHATRHAMGKAITLLFSRASLMSRLRLASLAASIMATCVACASSYPVCRSRTCESAKRPCDFPRDTQKQCARGTRA
mmetsp:Transcript_5122/g.19269  ORF Transcript_5122/g.19269 Transcript_5122/m.19269 type:complete len:233 (+) Transcript_5122:742-1440(+)